MTGVAAADRDLLLVFLIDALGATVVGGGGFLDPVAPAPRPAVRSILGFSSGAIPTLLTGRLPAEHGHWSMYRRAGSHSVFERYQALLRLAGRLPRGQWRIRQWLTRQLRRDGVTGYFALYEVPLGYLPLFDLCQRRNIYQPGAFPGIGSFFDRIAEKGLSYRLWDFTAPTWQALSEMEQAAGHGTERILFLYTAGLDATMHTHGPDSEAARVWLSAHGDRILAIVDAARRSGRRPIVRVFGDHGMAPVRRDWDALADLASLGLRMPQDYRYFLDSTMARFWFEGDSARRRVVDRLQDASLGRWLQEQEMRSLGVWFDDRAYGEEIFLCNPGVLIVPSFMGSSTLGGMHGYHPDDPDSDTVLIADPPPARLPRTIAEIPAMLLADLGLGAP
jgi:hypothetical protein